MIDINLITNDKKIKLSVLTKILIVIFLSLILFSFGYKIKIYDNYYAQIIERNDEFVLRIIIQNDTSKFIQNNQILVDNVEYKYEIINISKDCFNSKCYMVVDVKLNLDSKYLNNNYISINQITNESLFNFILKRIKKGMNL